MIEIAAGLLLAVAFTLFAVAFYRWATANSGHFAERGLAHLPARFLLGNTASMAFQMRRPDEFFRWLYEQRPDDKIFGIFDFRQPMVVLRDPELIKRMLVKDFDHFEDHRQFFDDMERVDEILGNTLFSLRGQKWRHMRATLSPAFTGSKMRSMFVLVNACCADMCVELRRQAEVATIEADERRGHPGLVLEMKDTFRRYANDVIASTAFGHRCNSFADATNAFLVNAERAFKFGAKFLLRFAMFMTMPRVFRLLRMKLFDEQAMAFFKRMVLDTMRQREEEEAAAAAAKVEGDGDCVVTKRRPDLISLLMQLRCSGAIEADTQTHNNGPDGFATAADDDAILANSSSDPNTSAATEDRRDQPQQPCVFTDNHLVAQCFMFYAAGFDTTSSILSFIAYELAINPDVQRQLHDECRALHDTLRPDRNGATAPRYEDVQRLEYMDQVVCETLRKWPATMFTDRECGKGYSYDDGEMKFEIAKGTNVWLPIAGLHYDERYFSEPERFVPERFSEENRASIVPGSYVPFGVGPRNCIASRFALMEIKAAVYHMLLEFSFEPTIQTQIPLRLKRGQNTVAEKGIHLELKLRTDGVRH